VAVLTQAVVGERFVSGQSRSRSASTVRYFSSRNLSFGSVTFFGLFASALA
jgi:hypothetical protein